MPPQPALNDCSETGQTPYHLLAEYGADIIARVTPNGMVLSVSPACRTLLGYEPDELISQSLYHFLHPDDIAKFKTLYPDFSNALPINSQIRHKEGHYVWFELSAHPIRDAQTKTIREIIAILRDITQRKKEEAEIRLRSHQLTLFQAAGAAINSNLDLRFVFDTVAQQMVKMFQVENCLISEWNQAKNTLAQIAGYNSLGWWDPDSPGRTLNLADYPVIKQVLEEQIPEQMIISQATIDPAEHSYMLSTGAKTRLILPMLFQRRVIALVELGDSRLERTFSYQEISLVKLLANQAANAIENARLFEQARQEIVERQQAEASLQKERALLAERVKERTAELSRVNAELAKAARLKDEFLASMSHELRTPLNAILGSSEILKTEVFGSLNEKQLKYTQNIEESGNHLLSLITDILDLSKIEAGKMNLEIRPVSVPDVCQSCLRMIKELAHKKQLHVLHKLDDNLISVQADERRLKQMLVNLLSNAVKFTPEGGNIGLDVSGDPEQELICFSVWDTGIGISEEDMSQLFQPFVQLDSSLSRQYAGTGLGLSLVSRMAEMHDGGISVESRVGAGSRFSISLPWRQTNADIVPPETPVAPPDFAPNQPMSPHLILLAEDNEFTISNLTDYLQARKYEVVVARNGLEAIKHAHEYKPAIILMDVQMPEMDGLEATRRLKADALTAYIPIIAITALAMSGDKERCLDAGADDYMSKPLSLKKLVNAIERVLPQTDQKKDF